ncbi:LysR family transcriptional regulator [Subtercola vilae]|uniref:LysR family transcriptional regulator n=1 Tax=Subtercola vilae TaxID=2056433 RepID=UPI001375542D
MTLDVVTLRILAAIAATGTFTAAAALVGMSQQAASSRIRAAERALGFAIANRTSGGQHSAPVNVLAMKQFQRHPYPGKLLVQPFPIRLHEHASKPPSTEAWVRRSSSTVCTFRARSSRPSSGPSPLRP